MREQLSAHIRGITLRQVRSEFQRIYKELFNVVKTNREAGEPIHDMYVDSSTNELVIVHEGGEKRIT